MSNASSESTISWWTVKAGTEDGMQGETGSIRAADDLRARELYLSQRPANWVIFDIAPGKAPEVRDPMKVALATAAAQEDLIASRKTRRGKR